MQIERYSLEQIIKQLCNTVYKRTLYDNTLTMLYNANH